MVLPAPLAPESSTISPVDARGRLRRARETSEQADGGAATDDGRHSRLRDCRIGRQSLRTAAESGRTGDAARPERGVSLADHAPGARSRRPRPGHRRAPAPPVRRLPALGHRPLHRPGPERPEGPVRAGAARGRHHHDHADRHDRHDAGVRRSGRRRPRPSPRSRRPRRATPSGRIEIPKIGVEQTRSSRASTSTTCARGPGHYPSTQMPGHEGNSAIAGHRTTYGAPVRRSRPARRRRRDRGARPSQGDFTLQGHRDRSWSTRARSSVLDPTPDPARPGHHLATLTLTTCNPKYSAEQRLIVKASARSCPQVSAPLPPTKVAGRRAGHDHRRARRASRRRARRRSSGARIAAGDRSALVAAVPPPPALDHVVRRRDPVPRRAVRRLHVPRAPAAVELLIDGRLTTRRSGR